jgi:hypothetical protein
LERLPAANKKKKGVEPIFRKKGVRPHFQQV